MEFGVVCVGVCVCVCVYMYVCECVCLKYVYGVWDAGLGPSTYTCTWTYLYLYLDTKYLNIIKYIQVLSPCGVPSSTLLQMSMATNVGSQMDHFGGGDGTLLLGGWGGVFLYDTPSLSYVTEFNH